MKKHLPALLLILSINLPYIYPALVNNIFSHWYVYVPIHILWGYLLAGRISHFDAILGRTGIPELLIVSFVFIYWMIPVNFDASLNSLQGAAFKSVSFIFFVGFLLRVGFKKANFIVKALFYFENIATLLRVGWVFIVAENRLCVNYLLSDQQSFGKSLLFFGCHCCHHSCKPITFRVSSN